MAMIEMVKKILTLLSQTKPGTDLSTVNIEAYHLVLAPVPDEVLEQASLILARQPGAFLPSAGDLYDASLDLLDESPDVADAWALVLRRARGADVDLPARAAKAVARIGGTTGWLEKDISYRRREFMEAYGEAGREWRERMALPGVTFKALPEGGR